MSFLQGSEAAYFVEADIDAFLLNWLEEIALDDLLAREEKHTVSPLLANVTIVTLEIHVPVKR